MDTFYGLLPLALQEGIWGNYRMVPKIPSTITTASAESMRSDAVLPIFLIQLAVFRAYYTQGLLSPASGPCVLY
jgi:hypothetical protein